MPKITSFQKKTDFLTLPDRYLPNRPKNHRKETAFQMKKTAKKLIYRFESYDDTHTHTYTHASGLKNDFTAVRSSTGPLTRNIEYSIFVQDILNQF